MPNNRGWVDVLDHIAQSKELVVRPATCACKDRLACFKILDVIPNSLLLIVAATLIYPLWVDENVHQAIELVQDHTRVRRASQD